MSALILWSLRALVTILVGMALAVALRRRSAAARNLVLRATLAMAWALPLLVMVAPRVSVPALPSPPTPLPQRGEGRTDALSQTMPMPITQGWSVERNERSEPTLVRRRPFSTAPVAPTALLLPLWFVGTGLVLLRWVVGMMRLRRSHPGRGHEPSGDYRLAGVPAPLTYGRAILLPYEAEAWPEATVRAAVLHERVHVARRDWYWQTLATLFCALHWPNPLAWILARRLRDTAEAAADDAALLQMRPSDYARALLAVADRANRAPGPAMAMARRGGVKDRVVSVLASGRDRRAPTRRLGLLLFAALAATGLAVAGVRERLTQNGQAPKAPHTLRDGRTVEVVEVRDETARTVRRWTPDGKLLRVARKVGPWPDRTPPARKGWRRVSLVLRQRGGDVRDAAQRVVETPTLTFFSGLGHRLNDHKAIETWITRFDVPAGTKRADLTLLFATGPWKAWDGPALAIRVTEKRVAGKAAFPPVTRVAFPLPRALTGKNVRIRALDRRGRTLVAQGVAYVPPAGPGNLVGSATVDLEGKPAKWIDHVEVEYRDYESVEVPSLALTPTANLDVRLLGLFEVAKDATHGWTADGKGGPVASVVNFRKPVKPHFRRLTARFRIAGPLSNVPEAELSAESPITPGSITFFPADGTVFQRGGRPNETFLWCTFQVPKSVRTASLLLSLANGPWTTHAEMAPGEAEGQATVQTGNAWTEKGKRFQNVTVTPHVASPPAPERRIELTAFDERGRALGWLLTSSWQPSYSFPLDEGQQVAKWVLRSRPLGYAAFKDAQMFPSPRPAR